MPAAPEFLRNIPEQERPRVNSNSKAEIRRRLPEKLEESLSDTEGNVLQGLEQVVDNIDPIWQVQKQTPFYFRGATEAEIRELGKTNSEILSPYTYAEKRNGTIIAVPYHEKFAEEIGPIVENIGLTQLIIPAHNYELMAQFYDRLTTLKEAFESDKWEEADKERFKKPWVNKVEFVIGPFEVNIDSFGIKTSYQAVVGVIDEEKTRELERRINAAKSRVKGKEIPNIELKVMHVTAATGITNPSTREPWKAQVLPNDPEFVRKVGARGLIFINLLEEHFETKLYPIMKRVFEPGILQKITKLELFNAYLIWIALHELHHPITREVNQDERQGSKFLPFHEKHCDIAGTAAAFRLAEDNIIRDEQFEAILMVHIARSLNDIYSYQFSNKKFPDPYAEGSQPEFNYLAEFSGLKPPKEDGKLGLYQKDQLTAAIVSLNGKFNIDAKRASKEELEEEFFSRYRSGKGYKFAEPLLQDLFEEPQPVLSS